MNNYIISSARPAERFGESFPLGNGNLGAMVQGGIVGDKFLISENTFFSGSASAENNQKDASQAFHKIAALCKQAKFEDASEAANDFIGIRHNYGTNLPVGELSVTIDSTRHPVNYNRQLNIREGTVSSSYEVENRSIDKFTYISSRLNALVHRVTSPLPFSAYIDFQPYRTDVQEAEASFEIPEWYYDGFSFSTHALESIHSDGSCGVILYGRVKIFTDGSYSPNSNTVKNAKQLTLVFLSCTDFRLEKRSFLRNIANLNHSSDKLTNEQIDSDIGRHKTEMAGLFDRSELKLDISGDGIESKVPFLYQYGRYLLYCSSNSGSQLPAHLQGIWNDNVACRIGWTCDMHLDINTQMNYWPANLTGIPEANLPLFNWIEETLVPQGRIAARESYGFPGWSAEIVSNAWGFAAPYWAKPIAPCPACGIWILTHMFEHYLYTEDINFLTHRAFPLIHEAVQFFLRYVYLSEQNLYSSYPSISPENSFSVNGRTEYMSCGTTFDILMIRELFDIYLKSVECIESSLVDRNVVDKVREIKNKLLPYRVLENGTIAEWNHNYPAVDRQHRHTSHLLGLYPFSQITPEDTPELAQAAAKSIREKLEPPENWEDTGWARSMLILYSARLGFAKEAQRHIQDMLNTLLEPNGMIIHPPTRGAAAFDNVYEMDGNTGLTTGIAEMLMQSHNGKIRILPALPNTWKNGSVTGLIARGNISVSIIWKNNQLEQVTLMTKGQKNVVLVYGGIEKNITIEGTAVLNQDLQ